MINPTSIKSYAVDALVTACTMATYDFEIYVLNDEFLGIPENVKRAYPTGQHIMLSIRNDLNPDITFDFEKNELVWIASFQGIESTVIVPTSNIIAIIDRHNNCAVQFAIIDPNIKSSPKSSPKSNVATSDDLAKPGAIIRELKHLKLIKGGKK